MTARTKGECLVIFENVQIVVVVVAVVTPTLQFFDAQYSINLYL